MSSQQIAHSERISSLDNQLQIMLNIIKKLKFKDFGKLFDDTEVQSSAEKVLKIAFALLGEGDQQEGMRKLAENPASFIVKILKMSIRDLRRESYSQAKQIFSEEGVELRILQAASPVIFNIYRWTNVVLKRYEACNAIELETN